jgi:hypothetical protein
MVLSGICDSGITWERGHARDSPAFIMQTRPDDLGDGMEDFPVFVGQVRRRSVGTYVSRDLGMRTGQHEMSAPTPLGHKSDRAFLSRRGPITAALMTPLVPSSESGICRCQSDARILRGIINMVCCT